MTSAAVEHGKGPKSTPVVAAGKVYTFGISGVLSCVDAASGKVIWRTEASGSPIFGTAMSPLLDQGLLLAHRLKRQGGAHRLQCGDGQPKWSWNGDGPATLRR
ncbi:MAG: PQQ-binding-like beta-propeller repeat protein [Bryobacteraceae bacterium]